MEGVLDFCTASPIWEGTDYQVAPSPSNIPSYNLNENSDWILATTRPGAMSNHCMKPLQVRLGHPNMIH